MKVWFLMFLVLAHGAASSGNITYPIQSVYQLGDSISDTGDGFLFLALFPNTRRPYGETFPGHPTGRWSDGRLPIDYIAMALGLPLLNPYMTPNVSFDNGVNFAAGGSTALDSAFYVARLIPVTPVPSSSVQLGQFKSYLRSICSKPLKPAGMCANELSRSLVFVGEFGYNDIRYPFIAGRSIQEIRSYIPLVVQAIINVTRELLEVGASQVIVPGNFPLGCFPDFLSGGPRNNRTAYDEDGCLKSVNDLTSFENDGLQRGLDSLRREFPNATLLYADYYNAFLSLLREAPTLGFDTNNLFRACCGVDVQYGSRDPGFCGNILARVCPDPSIYIHWDGIHLTQEAYRRISQTLISDLGIKSS